jgi:hypothetical protein
MIPDRSWRHWEDDHMGYGMGRLRGGTPGLTIAASLAAAAVVAAIVLATTAQAHPANAPAVRPLDPPDTTDVVAPAPTVTPTHTRPVVTDTPMAIDQVLPGPAVLTATRDVNVRGGPGVDYPVLGALHTGETATITGVSTDATWLQIVFASGAGDRGWVSRRYADHGDLAGVPVVSVPPPTVLPTLTPTPAVTLTPAPPPVPAIVNGWLGEYYDNLLLQGPARLVRDDAALDFNWGGLSPSPDLPNDDFSARWTRLASFDDSTYHFTVEADDGVRVWLDDTLVMDEWHDTQPAFYASDIHIGAGMHSLRVEYYEHLGSALIRVAWRKPGAWKAEYFNNRKLQDDPILERYDDELEFDWAQGSPDPVVSADNFSARWTREVDFDEGSYAFVAEADDGVRLWVDGHRLIDSWDDGMRTQWAERSFSGDGKRTVRVEYYEHYGGARIKVRWIHQ